MHIALFIMKNKKGMNMTLEQLIKIILGVMGVVMFLLLIYILVYRVIFPGGLAENQAKGTVESLIVVIDSLQQQGESKDSEPVYLPKGWIIIGFKSDSTTIKGFGKPDTFIGKNAVCVCQKTCKRETCRELKKPLQIDEVELFIYKIGEPKKFTITDIGTYYEIKEKIDSDEGGTNRAG